MKIAEVTPVYPPYKGGIGTVCAENAKMFLNLGATLDVFTPLYTALKGKVSSHETRDGISVRRITPLFERGNAAVLPHLLWHLFSYDIIHLHYPFLDATSVVVLVKALWKRKKLIVTYHMDLVGSGIRAFIFRLYTACILPLIVKKADGLFVTSLDYAHSSHLKRYLSLAEKKVYEVPCSVDTGRFFPKAKSQQLFELYAMRPDEKVILFVGGLDSAHYFKGVNNLLSAVASLPNKLLYRLIIVGDGDLKVSYQKKAAEIGIADTVIFADDISHDVLSDYYNLSDCVCLPSIDSSEAFGIVLIEAGACGKAVIASNLPGVRSVVDDGRNGFLVQPNNIPDLTDKLKRILTDSDLTYRMGQEGLKKVRLQYSNVAVQKKLAEIIKSFT